MQTKKDINKILLDLSLELSNCSTANEIIDKMLPLYKTGLDCKWVEIVDSKNKSVVYPERVLEKDIINFLKNKGLKTGESEDLKILEINSENSFICAFPLFKYGWLILAFEENLSIELRNRFKPVIDQLGKSLYEVEKKGNIKLFQSLISNTSDAIQVATEDGQLYYLNETATKRLGIKAEEAHKYTVFDIEEIFDNKKDWETHLAEMKSVDYLTVEGINRNLKTGKKFPVEVTVKYIEIEGKGFVIGNSRDINERIKAEVELRKLKEQYELAIEGSNDGIWDWNIKTKETFFSKRWKEILGYEDDELKNEFNSFVSLIHEEDRDEVLGFLNSYLDGKEEKYHIDFRMIHKDGSIRWISAKGAAVRDSQGRVYRMAGSHTDITRRKNIENELRQAKELNEQAGQMARVGAWEFDVERDKLTWSSVTKKIMGVPMDFEPTIEQAIGFYREEYSRKKIASLVQRAIDTGQGYDEELEIVNTSEEVKWTRSVGKAEFKDGKCKRIYGTFQDIHAEKEKTLELNKTKKQLEGIFNEMSDVVWSMTVPDYNMLFLTPSIYKLTGYTSEFLMNQKNWWENVAHPDNYDIIDKCLDQLDQKGEFYEIHRILTKSGKTKWVSNKGKYVYDEKGNPIRFDAIIRDFSSQIKAEQELQQELDLQNILIKISSTYININLDHVELAIQKSLEDLGTFVDADRVYVFDYNFESESISNTYEWCAEGITPEIQNSQNIPLKSIRSLVKKHLKGEPFYVSDVSKMDEMDFKAILQSQGIKSLITIPMVDGNNLIGFVGLDSVLEHHRYSDQEKKLLFIFAQMLINIRNRQKRENQLTLQEEKYRNIISNLNLGLLNVDQDQNITFVNSIFCEMSGYKAEELVGKNISEFNVFNESYETIKAKEELRRKGIPDTYDVKVNVIDGEERWWLISGAPNYNDKGEIIGTVGAMLDITEQKQMQHQLASAKILAEQAGKAKEIFLAKMSHEIRTPLSVVIGMIRQLSREALSEQQNNYVHHADLAAKHLLTILNNILDMAKIDAEELTLESKNFSINSLVFNLKNIFSQQANEKNLDFKVYISSKIQPAHIGDEVRLKQVLFNLLGNSIKFTSRGFVSLVIEVVETTETHQTIKVLTVDSGIGMSEDFINNIFEKFSQEHDSSNKFYKGTGLGMSISRDIVQKMGGELKVTSKKKVGSIISFDLELPIGDSSLITNGNSLNFDSNALKEFKILVVEDNEMNRFIVCQSLSQTGIEVKEAQNGEEAIKILQNETFDLIFMDIQMPKMNGLETTQYIRDKMKLDTPIIALTANAFKHDIDMYLKSGMNDFITKPYEEKELYRKINYHLQLFEKKDPVKPNTTNQNKQVEVKYYDLSYINEIGQGNEAFLQKMLTLFVRAANETSEKLKTFCREGDLEGIRKVSHKIKPSIDQMGIISIKDKIRELEKFSLEKEQKEDLEILIDEVCNTLTKVATDIEKNHLK
nr:PAS domain S-box protein [Saprospiraceae bacterium]